MARRNRPSLVSEIARLLVEYPQKDWNALVGRIRNRPFLEDLAAAIDDTMEVMETVAENREKGRPRSRGRILDEVAREDQEKAEILSRLKLQLTDKDQFVTLAHIRGFASSLGMKEELANRRNQAVNQIVRYLASKRTDEIATALQAALAEQAQQGQEFHRWVDLILGSRLPHKSLKNTPKDC